MSLADKLIEIERNVPKVYEAGYAEGEEAGYNKGYADASDTNLFDIDNPVFIAKSAYNKTYVPRIEDGVFYGAGLYGDSDGAAACVPVNAGDIITLSASFSSSGRVTVVLLAGTSPVDGIFTAYEQLASALETAGMNGTKCWAVQIPDGYEWFGFSAAGATRYGVQLTDICITKQNNAVGEQAVAYNILTGVVE